MKTNICVLMIGLLAFVAACSDDESSSPATVDVASESAIDEAFEEIDVITEAGMTIENANGRTAEDDETLVCSTVTRDPDNNMITIDFGDGCEGRGGRVRSGKIIITYSDRRYIPGASRTVTFENFFIDGAQIEGTRTMANVSASENDNPRFNITLVGGRVTFEDGSTATREANHTRTWMRSGSPLTDESTLEGSASGVDRDGNTYSITITSPLVYKRACHAERVFIPVQGVQEILKGDNTGSIDYGDGTCDNIVTVTVNGVTETKEIQGLRIGRKVTG